MAEDHGPGHAECSGHQGQGRYQQTVPPWQGRQ